MSKMNFFELLEFPQINMIGFEEVEEFFYVTISRLGPQIFIFNKESSEKDYRFRIDVGDEKNICNERLYHLLNHFNLNEKLFVYDYEHKIYIPTSISVIE